MADGREESIAVSCIILPVPSSSHYNVMKDGAGKCDLIIHRAEMSLAGVYTCFDVGATGQTASAYLTVIG